MSSGIKAGKVLLLAGIAGLVLAMVPCAVSAGAEMEEDWNATFSIGQYNDYYTVLQTADGGYLLGGLAARPDSAENAVLLKTDKYGHEQWNRTYSGDRVTAAEQLADGGYVFILTGGSPVVSALARADPNGELIWETRLDGAESSSLLVTPQGNYAVAGWSPKGDAGEEADSFLTAYAPDGKRVLNMTYPDRAFSSVAMSGDDGFVLAGCVKPCNLSTIPKGVVMKTDASGNGEWSKTFENSSINTVIPDSDGGYLVVGSAMQLSSMEGGWWETRAWASYLDKTGAEVWSKQMPGLVLYDAAEIAGEGYVLTGMWGDYSQVLLIDQDGEVFSSKKYDAKDRAGTLRAVELTEDGGYAVSGWIRTDGDVQGLLVKFAAPETPALPTTAKSPGFGVGIALIAAGILFVVGRRD